MPMGIPTIEKQAFPMLIGSDWIQTHQARIISLPYDGTPVAEVYDADAATVDRAVVAAQKGATAMAGLTLYERAELLQRMQDLLKRDAEEFSRLVALETGKTIREARGEVDRAQQTLAASANAARSLHGGVVPMEAAPTGKGRWAMTVREPLGVIAAITPFNFPLNLALHKIGPALAAGNSVVHKPSENTPLAALRLARLAIEAGVPGGAYNVVTGPGEETGRQIVNDARIAMITFTGSAEVGREIRAAAGLRRVTLEMGSNSSVILEPDCDLDMAVPRCVAGGYAMAGQVCISVQNIFVHNSIAEDFTARFVGGVRSLKIGHPLEESTDMASLISEAAAVRVESWIREAVARGARLLTGGTRHGTIIEPAVLTDVAPDDPVCCKEVFGPVVVLHRYTRLADAIDAVNASKYGLQAGICTRDIGKAFDAARKLRVGGVIVNDVPAFRVDLMPYGGTKMSGVGREGPRYAVEEMTELKLICWRG
ncbi:MAG: aldehyde dehydrogenase family protein [Acidobacteria bacterium]|nr:MAG: aldehyde dehydrogenase family protein [Acidobacteriota bacterium]